MNSSLEHVVDTVGGLAEAGIVVWVDGGWCVEALVGHEVRPHGDLDIAVSRVDEDRFRAWMVERGYRDRHDPIDTASNYVLIDEDGRMVDVHVFQFDAHGNHVYGVAYPAESLTGWAVLGGLPINCIPPEWMYRFKTGYAPAPKDIVDVQALADTYGYTVPEAYRTVGR